MQVKLGENLLYMAVLCVFGLIGIWVQSGIMELEEDEPTLSDPHQPDYYVENFTATGINEHGERAYVVEAERMVHFPDDGTALLDYPHVIEYFPDQGPRHTYSDSGWISADGDEILLTGNVKIVQEAYDGNPGGTIRSKRMRIKLDETKSVGNLMKRAGAFEQ